ncbi:hypothetical protein P350_31145 [Burkholderia cepacia JBK9]|uniref:hypothetical protein n=1 Tax=Burkholderia arboris TaxID=488730 RepID=UPI000740A0C6|nr:hypothetical protein [Burkholderia arboris]ALX15876.1 hypothetical protein P350_31145 [Burkholderia cepacia JBK9]MCA8491994.1 hypothetical protein [Burkholderia arboris]
MRLITPRHFSLGKRAALLFAFSFATMAVTLVMLYRVDRTGTIDTQAGNPYVIGVQTCVIVLYALLGWVWIVRPARHNQLYFPGIVNQDRQLIAWFVLVLNGAIFVMVPLLFNTATLNRMAERTKHVRSVVARSYRWQATTGGGKNIPRHSYTTGGLLFADAAGRGMERVPSPGGPSGDGATCFVEHTGWLGQRWISDVHPCDTPVEHIRLERLADGGGELAAQPGLQCLDDEPATAVLTMGADAARCPAAVRRDGRWVVVANGAAPSSPVLAALPLPDDFWDAPKVASVSPDGDRILVGDFGLRSPLFLWSRHAGAWVALQLPPSYPYNAPNRYVLTSDAHTIDDCPLGPLRTCERWGDAGG